MSKKNIFFSLIALSMFLFSCSETSETGEYDNWRSRNETFLDSLQNVYDTASDHGGLEFFVPYTDPTMKIYYKATDSNSDGARPIIPNVVSVYYRGSLINGVVFDENFTGADPGPFDSPSEFWVNPVSMTDAPHTIPIMGWIETLQQMNVGDRWTVYLPADMGYGSSLNGSIPGYSTLIFDMSLEAIVSQE